jgi:hypothetical protein
MIYRNALWVLVTVAVSFWVGVIFARIFPHWDTEFVKLLIDTATAVGTVGAVIVALFVGNQQAAAVLRSVQDAHLLEVGSRQKSILAIAEAANEHARRIGDIFALPESDIPLALYSTFDQTIIDGIVRVLSTVPAHEVGSRDGVIALLALRDQVVFLGVAIETYKTPEKNPETEKLFLTYAGDDPENRKILKSLRSNTKVVLAANVRGRVATIAQHYATLVKAINH